MSLVADPALAASRSPSAAPRASKASLFTAQALEPRALHHAQVIAGPSDPKRDALRLESRYYDLAIRSEMPVWLKGDASTDRPVMIKFEPGTAVLKGSVEAILARSGLAEHFVIALGELTQVDDSIPGTLGIMLSRHSAQFGTVGMALELSTVLDRLQGAPWPDLPAQPTPLYSQAERLERSLRKSIDTFQSTGMKSALENAVHEVYRVFLSAMPAEEAAEMPSTFMEFVETENPAFLGANRPLSTDQWFALLRMLIWQFNRECLVPAGGFLRFYEDPETLSVALRPARKWSVYAVGAQEYLFVDIDDMPHSIFPAWSYEGVDVNEAYVDELEMWKAAPRKLQILRNHQHPLLSVVARRLAALTRAQWVEVERRRIRRRATLKAGALVGPEKPLTHENLQSTLNPDGHSHRMYVLVEEGLSAIPLGGFLSKDKLVVAARYAAVEIDLLLRAPTPVDQQARLFHLLAAEVKFNNDEPMKVYDWAKLVVLRSAAAFMVNAKPGEYYMETIDDSIEKLALRSPQSLWTQLGLPPLASSPTSAAPLITSQSQAPTGWRVVSDDLVNMLPPPRHTDQFRQGMGDASLPTERGIPPSLLTKENIALSPLWLDHLQYLKQAEQRSPLPRSEVFDRTKKVTRALVRGSPQDIQTLLAILSQYESDPNPTVRFAVVKSFGNGMPPQIPQDLRQDVVLRLIRVMKEDRNEGVRNIAGTVLTSGFRWVPKTDEERAQFAVSQMDLHEAITSGEVALQALLNGLSHSWDIPKDLSFYVSLITQISRQGPYSRTGLQIYDVLERRASSSAAPSIGPIPQFQAYIHHIVLAGRTVIHDQWPLTRATAPGPEDYRAILEACDYLLWKERPGIPDLMLDLLGIPSANGTRNICWPILNAYRDGYHYAVSPEVLEKTIHRCIQFMRMGRYAGLRKAAAKALLYGFQWKPETEEDRAASLLALEDWVGAAKLGRASLNVVAAGIQGGWSVPHRADGLTDFIVRLAANPELRGEARELLRGYLALMHEASRYISSEEKQAPLGFSIARAELELAHIKPGRSSPLPTLVTSPQFERTLRKGLAEGSVVIAEHPTFGSGEFRMSGPHVEGIFAGGERRIFQLDALARILASRKAKSPRQTATHQKLLLEQATMDSPATVSAPAAVPEAKPERFVAKTYLAKQVRALMQEEGSRWADRTFERVCAAVTWHVRSVHKQTVVQFLTDAHDRGPEAFAEADASMQGQIRAYLSRQSDSIVGDDQWLSLSAASKPLHVSAADLQAFLEPRLPHLSGKIKRSASGELLLQPAYYNSLQNLFVPPERADVPYLKAVALRRKSWRESVGMTTEEVGRRMGWTRPNITTSENRQRRMYLPTLIKNAAALEMPWIYLIDPYRPVRMGEFSLLESSFNQIAGTIRDLLRPFGTLKALSLAKGLADNYLSQFLKDLSQGNVHDVTFHTVVKTFNLPLEKVLSRSA